MEESLVPARRKILGLWIVDFTLLIVDFAAGALLTALTQSFDDIVYWGLASILLLELRIVYELWNPESVYISHGFQQALKRAISRQLRASTSILVVSSNDDHGKAWNAYVTKTKKMLHRKDQVSISRVVDLTKWTKDDLMFHLSRMWEDLKAREGRAPQYKIWFAATGTTGVVVIDETKEASIFVYTGRHSECFYLESSTRGVVRSAKALFDHLSSTEVGAVRFPPPDSIQQFNSEATYSWMLANLRLPPQWGKTGSDTLQIAVPSGITRSSGPTPKA